MSMLGEAKTMIKGQSFTLGNAASGDFPTKRVLFPVTPQTDEPIHNLLARVCSANSYDDQRWLLHEAGLANVRQFKWSAAQVERMSELLGLPFDDVAGRVYLGQDGNHAFLFHRISRSHFESGRAKLCPHCFEEKGYRSAYFDLSAIQACPKHAVQLLTQCTTCQAKLAPHDVHQGRCIHCSTDLRTMPAASVDPESLAGTAVVAQAAGFGPLHPSIKAICARFDAAFGHLDLQDKISLLVRFGTYVAPENTRRLWRTAMLVDREIVASRLNDGWDVVREWPTRFYQLLNKIDAEHRATEWARLGLRNTFGPLYSYLHQQTAGPWQIVRDAFDIYAREHWTGLSLPARKRSRLVKPSQPRKSKFATTLELARESGMPIAKVEGLVRAGTLTPVAVEGQGLGRLISPFVEREAFNALVPAGSDLFSLKDAAARIGLSPSQTKRLADSQAITAVDGPYKSGNKRYLFAQPHLDAFVAPLIEAAEIIEAFTKQHVGVSKFLKAQSTLGVPLSEALAYLTTGKIRVVRLKEGQSSLNALRIEQSQAIEVLNQPRVRADLYTVTRAWAEAELGVNKATVAWLVANGYLAEGEAHGRLRPIARASFDNFAATYIKAGDIADRFGSNRMLVQRALAAAGIPSIFHGAMKSQVVTQFYERALVDLIDLSARLDEVAFHRNKAWSVYDRGLRLRNAAKPA